MYLRSDLADFVPYKTENVEYKIKMDANESPFELPERLRRRLADELVEGCGLNFYPDSDSTRLREAIADYWGIDCDEVMVGAGSDELINIAANAFVCKGDRVICPVPSFGMYRIFTRISGGVPVEIPLDGDYNYPMDLFFEAVEKHRPKVIFLCTPNNPTGSVISQRDMIRLAENFSGVIVVDEAYGEFCGDSFTRRALSLPNVVVLHTFSKAMGMAALRVGYLTGNREIVSELYRVKPPYNVNSFSQRAAELMILEEVKTIRERVAYIIEEREKLICELKGIPGVTVYPSRANFVLVRVADGNYLYNQLLKRGILVRNFSNAPYLENCLRITVSTRENNRMLVDAVAEIMKDMPRV